MNEMELHQILFGRLNRLELPSWPEVAHKWNCQNLSPSSFTVRPHIESGESQLGIQGLNWEEGGGQI